MCKLKHSDVRRRIFEHLNFDGTWNNFKDQEYATGVELKPEKA